MSENQQREPLFKIPIPMIGLTGEVESGKTLFMLSICPGPETLVYDFETSCESYSVGQERIDCTQHINSKSRVDLFAWWYGHAQKLPANKYRVIGLDPVSEIEEGLVEYVEKNPQLFGYTAAQFAKGEALKWGAVKNFWKSILSELRSRTKCEIIVFTSHMRDEFKGGRPTEKRIPKGKETLAELASLYLELDRSPNTKGVKPREPSAIVKKNRLSLTQVVNGELKITTILPARLPVATPAAIKWYIDNPSDPTKPGKGERIEEKVLSADQIKAMELALAEANRDTEALRLERLNRTQQAAARVMQPTATQPAAQSTPEPFVVAVPSPTNGNGHVPQGSQAVTEPGAITQDRLDKIAFLYRSLTTLPVEPLTNEQYRAALSRRGVHRAGELSQVQADEFIGGLQRILQSKQPAATVAAGASMPME